MAKSSVAEPNANYTTFKEHPVIMSQNSIDSEHYRQMLVKDGERRYREWHTAFLRYQQKFLQEMAQTRQR